MVYLRVAQMVVTRLTLYDVVYLRVAEMVVTRLTLDDVVYLRVAEMVVTRLSRWMTWSTCGWLRWWLLDSVAG